MKEKETIIEKNISDTAAHDAPGEFNPKIGHAYKMFVSEKNIPGTPSFVAHKLMTEFNEEKKKDANELISNTLAPADLVSYMLEKVKEDPEAMKVFNEELQKRLIKIRHKDS